MRKDHKDRRRVFNPRKVKVAEVKGSQTADEERLKIVLSGFPKVLSLRPL
jgi:hypothetical protein